MVTPQASRSGAADAACHGLGHEPQEQVPLMFYVVPHLAQADLNRERRAAVDRYLDALQRGDASALQGVLTADAVTRWPQSGERITGSTSCARVHASYPGGPPTFRIERVSGDGDVWVVELVAEYDDERWYTVSVIRFIGWRISRITDYFGQSFPAPAWRQELVEMESAPA